MPIFMGLYISYTLVYESLTLLCIIYQTTTGAGRVTVTRIILLYPSRVPGYFVAVINLPSHDQK